MKNNTKKSLGLQAIFLSCFSVVQGGKPYGFFENQTEIIRGRKTAKVGNFVDGLGGIDKQGFRFVQADAEQVFHNRTVHFLFETAAKGGFGKEKFGAKKIKRRYHLRIERLHCYFQPRGYRTFATLLLDGYAS